MNYQNFTEIKSDQAYSDGFDTAKRIADKKYQKLFEAAASWMHIYESAFGTPDENTTPEYWRLRKLLKMPS